MDVQVFGVRHHGPGCARSLVEALAAFRPDTILIEGPPDADDVLPQAATQGMEPPVTILIYPPDEPRQAVFYPFAEFSPEWQTIRYALQQQIPARFIDLPQANQLAILREERAKAAEEAADPQDSSNGDGSSRPVIEEAETESPDDGCPDVEFDDDPVGALALAAGYSDRELWWEHQIEQRRDPSGMFQGIMEAMVALRAELQTEDSREASSARVARRRFGGHREAFMRQQIRQAKRDKFERVAVVCGAWHAPVLMNLGPAAADAELLKGLPKIKVASTWAPWSFSRLAARSGYGAGINSPGWYDHLWRFPDGAVTRWVTRAARLLRDEGLDVSSASVIEAVRLGEALAAMRDLPMPGLQELAEAIFTILCHGESARYALVRDKLEIGARLGRVPEEVAVVPLQRDLEAQQRRLRLQPSTELKTLDLDLRKENDRARSALLHRLNFLDIAWGEPLEHRSQAGTFHEIWRLEWQVEFVAALIDASVWGNTVESAATNSAISRSEKATTVADLTALLDQSILAELPDGVQHTLERLDEVGAVGADILHLMEALPSLARVLRYGDVRQTPTERLQPVVTNFLERILVGLPPACASLDDEAAQRMVESIGSVQESLNLLDDRDHRAEWHDVLRRLMTDDVIHGLVRGWCCRLLLESRALMSEELAVQTSRALSPAVDSARAGAWIEGLLRGSAFVLLHEDALWSALDAWLGALDGDNFVELLPVFRRAVSGFQPPERRAMGEKVKQLGNSGAGSRPRTPKTTDKQLDRERAELVIPILAHILGVEPTWRSDDRR